MYLSFSTLKYIAYVSFQPPSVLQTNGFCQRWRTFMYNFVFICLSLVSLLDTLHRLEVPFKCIFPLLIFSEPFFSWAFSFVKREWLNLSFLSYRFVGCLSFFTFHFGELHVTCIFRQRVCLNAVHAGIVFIAIVFIAKEITVDCFLSNSRVGS